MESTTVDRQTARANAERGLAHAINVLASHRENAAASSYPEIDGPLYARFIDRAEARVAEWQRRVAAWK